MKILRFLGGFAFALLIFVACGSNETPAAPPVTPKPPETAPVPPKVKVIVVKNLESPYRFEPKILELEKGKLYEVQLVGGNEFHTFTVLELGINQVVEPNKTVSIFITVGKPGTYDLTCLPHLTQGMVGKITVK